MALLRNGLSYSQASANASSTALRAYAQAKERGYPEEEALEVYRNVYDEEMDWYES